MKEILITIAQLFIVIAGMCLFSWFDLFFTLHNILTVFTVGLVYLSFLSLSKIVFLIVQIIKGVK